MATRTSVPSGGTMSQESAPQGAGADLVLSGLTKRFATFTAVDDLDLRTVRRHGRHVPLEAVGRKHMR